MELRRTHFVRDGAAGRRRNESACSALSTMARAVNDIPGKEDEPKAQAEAAEQTEAAEAAEAASSAAELDQAAKVGVTGQAAMIFRAIFAPPLGRRIKILVALIVAIILVTAYGQVLL